MAQEKASEGFVFLTSYYEAINELPDDQSRAEMMKAIIDYGITGSVDFDKLSPIVKFGMKIIMPIIKKQKDTYDRKKAAGKQGGRGNKANDSESTEESTEKQTIKQNAKQNESTNKADVKQNESTNKADVKQNESTNKADAKQSESTSKADVKQSEEYEKADGRNIYNNNIDIEIENKNNIVCVKGNQKQNENTQTKIEEYFAKKGYSSDVAARFVNYNLDHNGKIPTDWQHYADNYMEREKKSSSSGVRLLTYDEVQTLAVSGKAKFEDFDRIPKPDGGKGFMYKLKTA